MLYALQGGEEEQTEDDRLLDFGDEEVEEEEGKSKSEAYALKLLDEAAQR